MTKASLDEKFALIHEHWRPKVIAGLDGQELKLVKLAGVFPWHRHEPEDELFLVWRGQMTIELRDRKLTLQAGEFCVVPRASNTERWPMPKPRFCCLNRRIPATRGTSWSRPLRLPMEL